MNVIELTPGQSAVLAPVAKWRVIDLKSIISECSFSLNYSSFCRTIRQLEKRGVVGSYRRHGEGKKYIYLTRLGEQLVGQEDSPTSINPETLLHDLLVSDFVRGLLELGSIDSFELEHEIHNKREFGSAGRLVPDAQVHGQKNGKKFRLAVELELTVKSHARVEDKLRHYESQKYYDYFLYVFPKSNYLENFLQFAKARFGENVLNRLMCFFWDGSRPVQESIGHFKGQRLALKEIFS